MFDLEACCDGCDVVNIEVCKPPFLFEVNSRLCRHASNGLINLAHVSGSDQD